MKKINKKGFFLSETMVVMAVVAVVILSVFKLFNSVYYRFIETEDYNTANAINALSNIKKYYESLGNIDTELITEDIYYVDLTNYEKYESEYYTRLKNEFKIDSIYLIDLNKLSNAGDFHIHLRKYLDTLKNKEGIILLVSINGKEFAYTEILHYSSVTLVGDEEDEFGVYVNIGDEFIDPGYINWDGDEPTTIWENEEEVNTSKEGTYYLHYDFNGKIFRRKVVVGNYVSDFVYTGDYQVYEVPYDGYYKVELWGAQGGKSITCDGGKGAYVSGLIELFKDKKIYFNVGGQGIQSGTEDKLYLGGYNGGADAYYEAGTGGGATDVRIDGKELINRIMVAAGGGGSGIMSDKVCGGSAGGLIGYAGGSYFNETITGEFGGRGGTQVSGGLAGDYWTGEQRENTYLGTNGSFGIGGIGGYESQTKYKNGSGAGGAGYYGGGGGSERNGGGGGGSSFISGHNGCNAIKQNSNNSSIIHTGQSIHFSGYKFTNTIMIDGSGYKWTTEKSEYTGMPSYNGREIIVGNVGNGYAKITFIGTNYESKN